MHANHRDNLATRVLPRLTPIFPALAILLGLIVLIEWATNSLRIARASAEFIPMAPSTALCFVLLGAVLLCRQWRRGDRIVQGVWRTLAGIVLIFSAVLLLQFALVTATGLPLGIEQWIVPASRADQGYIAGRMSQFTALLFALLSSATLVSFPIRDVGGARDRVAQSAAAVVLILAGILVVGYWYGAPLLYGGTLTPVALPTAIGLILLSVGLLLDGPHALLARWITSTSVFARFTRWVLPGTVAIILVAGWAHLTVLKRLPPVYDAVFTSLIALFTAGLVALLTTVVARQVQATVTRAVQALRESEQRYRSLFENMLHGFAYCKMVFENNLPRDFIYLDVNSAFEDLTGLKNVVGRKVTEVIKGVRESNPELFEIYGRVALSGKPERFETYVEPLGIWLSISVYCPQREHFVAVFDNITERKRAEEVLRASEERFRRLAESAHDTIFIVNREGYLEYINNYGASRFGRPAKNIVGQPLEKLFPSATVALQREDQQQVFDTLEPVLTEDKITFPHGDVWLSTALVPLSDESGQARAIMGIARDVTERKRMEETLEQERNLLRTLMDNLPDFIYVKDTESRFLLKNLADARQMGAASPDETIGKTDFDYYPPELATQYYNDDQAVIHSGKPIVNREELISDATGRSGWFLTTKVPLRDAQGEVIGLVGIGRDVTERKQAEEDIRRRLAELEAVNRVSTAMRAAQSLDEMLPLLLDETLAVLGTDAGAIWLQDESGAGDLRPVASRGWHTLIDDEHLRRGEGIAGAVFATGVAHVSREVVTDPLTSDLARTLIPAGWGGAYVPIRTARLLVGVVFVSVQVPRLVTAGEVNLLTTLAEIAGNAIHRTRLHEQTQQRLQRLDALRAIDQAISASVDLRVTFDVLLGQVTSRLGVDAADLLLLNPPAHILEYGAGHGFRTTGITRSRLRLGEGQAGRAALERRRLSIPDLSAAGDQFVRAPLLVGESFVAHHVTPLIAKGQVKGVLEVFHRSPLDTDPEWLEFFEALAGQAAIAIDNATLFDGLQRSNLELALAYDATIEGWSRALDLRDKETEGHTQRVAELTLRLGRILGMSESELVHVRRGALLHDIGKMGIPDAILLKAGPLGDEDWAIMRRHPTFAYDMLSPIAYLRPALDIPHCHHEKWDGTGYPRGLNGDQIPLTARIFAVVDVWDALLSDRPYRAAWPEDKARQYIHEQAGKHFDPQVAQAFLDLEGV